jgi:hypothetical protein
MSIQWITPGGFLFTATEAVNTSVSVVASGTNVSYNIISGELPSGLELSTNGTISGTPSNVLDTTDSVFVVRASNGVTVADNTFNIDVIGPNSPNWITTSSYLGVGYNGDNFAINHQWVSYQLNSTAVLAPSTATITYSKTAGTLPPGLHLSKSGLISGVVKDKLTFDGLGSPTGGYGDEKYDGYSYDHSVTFAGTLTTIQITSVPKIYQFDVTATDGVLSSTSSFKILVLSPDMLRADSSYLSFDASIISTNIIPSSVSNIQPLVFLHDDNLGKVRANNNQSLDVSAFDADPDLGPVTYSVTGTNILPQGLVLDPSVGHIYGYVPYQPAYTRSYTFEIAATKGQYYNTTTVTTINTFTLQVVGNVYSYIEWVSDSNLGTIDTGITSELVVKAKQISSDYNIKYQLIDGSLPSGLTLLQDGSIGGKVNYGSTGTSTFTVLASDIYGLSAISKTFNLTAVESTSTQYTRIYARPFMNQSKRTSFSDFINDESIFESKYLYRYYDINFGVQYDIKLILEFGIQKINLSDYIPALYQNFYRQRICFGDLKIAIAKDSKGKPLYEVVYLDAVDSGSNGSLDIIPTFTQNNKLYYPTSINNMRHRLESLVIDNMSYIDVNEYNMPRFMQTPQLGNYVPPGYMKVIPICYALPGEGIRIFRKIQKSGFDFKLLDFEIDRIIVQNSLDNSTDKYLLFARQSVSDVIPEDNLLFGPDGQEWIFNDNNPVTRE